MNKNINTSVAIGIIIAAAMIFGGLIWLNGMNIKIETPAISPTHPTQKQKTVNTTKIEENNQLLNDTQNKKLTHTSDKLGVSFDYEISGNQAIICESGSFIFDTESDSCPKSQEDINLALASPDVILEVFTKNQDKSLESSIKDILTKEKANLLNCNIDFSQKDFLYELIPNKQIAAIFAKGNICTLNDTVPGAKPCKRAEDICQSKYVNNTLTTSHNFFVYNPTDSKTKFIFHQCDNCYESTPDITIDLNSINFKGINTNTIANTNTTSNANTSQAVTSHANVNTNTSTAELKTYEDAFLVEIKYPAKYTLKKNTEANRRGSYESWDIIPKGNAPYLQELQIFRRDTIESFNNRCSNTPCFFGDYPTVERFDGFMKAFNTPNPQSYQDYQVITLGTETYLVKDIDAVGEGGKIREYNTTIGGVTLITLWAYIPESTYDAQADAQVEPWQIKYMGF